MVLNPSLSLKEIESLLVSEEGAIKEFMRQICAILSVDGQIAEVAGRVELELLRQGYDDVLCWLLYSSIRSFGTYTNRSTSFGWDTKTQGYDTAFSEVSQSKVALFEFTSPE